MKQLRLRDWWMVFAILTALASLSLIAVINRQPKLELNHFRVAVSAAVDIEGAVERPGTYRMGPDATVGELLDRAQLMDGADLTGLRSKRRLKDGERITIHNRPSIKVFVSGPVEREGEYQLYSPATMGDLLKVVSLTEMAQIRTLKRRQTLEDGAQIQIPERKRAPKR